MDLNFENSYLDCRERAFGNFPVLENRDIPQVPRYFDFFTVSVTVFGITVKKSDIAVIPERKNVVLRNCGILAVTI